MVKLVNLGPREKPPAGRPYVLVEGVLRNEGLVNSPQGTTIRVVANDLDDTIKDLMAKSGDGLDTIYVRRPKVGTTTKIEKEESTDSMRKRIEELLKKR